MFKIIWTIKVLNKFKFFIKLDKKLHEKNSPNDSLMMKLLSGRFHDNTLFNTHDFLSGRMSEACL